MRKGSIPVLLMIVLGLSMSLPMMANEKSITAFLWKAWTMPPHEPIGDWLELVREEFQVRHPDVTVEYMYANFGADHLIVTIAGGLAPDVAIASIGYALDLYDQGLLRSLSDYWSKSRVAKYDFFPSAMVFNQRDGRIFGAPWSMESYGIIYNAELFEEAGLNSDPYGIGSWDELVNAAKKLTRRVDDRITVTGFNVGLSTATLAGWLYANGGQFYNQTFDGIGFDDARGHQTLAFLADLHNVQLPLVRGPGGAQAFLSGQVAMMGNNLPAAGYLRDAPFRGGQTDFPPGPSGTHRSSVCWSNMFVIPEAARNPDLGWAWIETLLDPDLQAKLIEMHELISPYRQPYSSRAAREVVRQRPYLFNTADILANAGPYPYVRFREISEVINPMLTRMANGQLAPESLLSEVTRLVNPILKQASLSR
ncbi:MAG: ABC transporter substrate-binding protein [Limnochordia bacterium]|jgi:multiple sugar transport system substrate-binding protein